MFLFYQQRIAIKLNELIKLKLLNYLFLIYKGELSLYQSDLWLI